MERGAVNIFADGQIVMVRGTDSGNQTVTFVALPYLSLVGNMQDTPDSLATTGCRNSSPHTGRSGSPQSLPCTRSDRPPGTAGNANPQGHSHMLQGNQTSVRAERMQKYPTATDHSLQTNRGPTNLQTEPCSPAGCCHAWEGTPCSWTRLISCQTVLTVLPLPLPQNILISYPIAL